MAPKIVTISRNSPKGSFVSLAKIQAKKFDSIRSIDKKCSKARGSRYEDNTSKCISHARKLEIGCFERESTISDVVVSTAAKTRSPIFITRYAASSAMLRRTYCRMPP
jgi:hypothetical protein